MLHPTESALISTHPSCREGAVGRPPTHPPIPNSTVASGGGRADGGPHGAPPAGSRGLLLVVQRAGRRVRRPLPFVREDPLLRLGLDHLHPGGPRDSPRAGRPYGAAPRLPAWGAGRPKRVCLHRGPRA